MEIKSWKMKWSYLTHCLAVNHVQYLPQFDPPILLGFFAQSLFIENAKKVREPAFVLDSVFTHLLVLLNCILYHIGTPVKDADRLKQFHICTVLF